MVETQSIRNTRIPEYVLKIECDPGERLSIVVPNMAILCFRFRFLWFEWSYQPTQMACLWYRYDYLHYSQAANLVQATREFNLKKSALWTLALSGIGI